MPSVCLVVLDGWGLADPGPGNAVALADTPVFDELWQGSPHTTLTTSGEAVGLPSGQMGNSEVGHLNLGAGAVLPQDLKRIDDAVADGSFLENAALLDACAAGREAGRLHLVGLASDGGVHSSLEHFRSLIELAAREGVSDLVVHAFTDGRDTAPDSGSGHVERLEGLLADRGGRVGTVCGRYYAMDRDSRWDRTKQAYDAMVHGRGQAGHAASGVEAVRAAYERGETDEFILATVVGEDGRIRGGDAVLFVNFRPDRARQLTRALTEPGFDEFDRGEAPEIALTTMTSYREEWSHPAAFPPRRPETSLAQVVSERGGSQVHVAETEKYAHVTYFFNGGEEEEHAGESFRLVDSPRDVKTYDEKPEMSARAAAEALIEAWGGGERFGIINFANPDMVGHTGIVEAAVKAVEAADECLGLVVAAVHESGGACVITADHGNADRMLNDDGSPDTAHSLNPVPFVVTADVPGLRDGGVLADVAPTVLRLLGEDQPEEMTGLSLIVDGDGDGRPAEDGTASER